MRERIQPIPKANWVAPATLAPVAPSMAESAEHLNPLLKKSNQASLTDSQDPVSVAEEALPQSAEGAPEAQLDGTLSVGASDAWGSEALPQFSEYSTGDVVGGSDRVLLAQAEVSTISQTVSDGASAASGASTSGLGTMGVIGAAATATVAVATAGGDGDSSASAAPTVDTTAPTVTNTSANYTSSTDTLVITGTNYNTLLEAGETANTDIKARLDWTKLSWDINGDNATTANVSFSESDIASAKVVDATHLSIVLTSGKGIALEATSGYGGTTADTLDIAAGFARDTAGNVATSDAVADGTLTAAGQSVIDLGSYGKLIAPVQVEGNWYYYWDRSGDGSNANSGSLNGGVDGTTHDVLNGLFTQNINGETGNTTDTTYRYTTLNGVRVALPTNGESPLADNFRPGTTVSSGVVTNTTYDDLLAIWDAYNGAGTNTDIRGVPSGWQTGYWSATPSPSVSGYVAVLLDSGYVYFSTSNSPTYNVALQVL